METAPPWPNSLRNAAAARLAADLDHPAYDCFYLALAIQTQYPVVTADARFHDKVRGHPYLSERILHIAQAVTRRTLDALNLETRNMPPAAPACSPPSWGPGFRRLWGPPAPWR